MMKLTLNQFILIVLFQLTALNCYSGTCSDWFKESKINPNDKSCVSKCGIQLVDMSSFSCHTECEKFCRPKKCDNNPDWKSKIKNGRPINWTFKSEKTKAWSDTETKALEKTLNSLPEDFSKLVFDGFYRMEKSVQIINPATVSDEKSIVLYDSSFDHPMFKTDKVIVHELAHVFYMSFSAKQVQDYQRALGWTLVDNVLQRKGNFLKQDAQDSPEEDFATNLEYFLFENAEVKNRLPEAYKWITKKFSKNFKLKENCDDN